MPDLTLEQELLARTHNLPNKKQKELHQKVIKLYLHHGQPNSGFTTKFYEEEGVTPSTASKIAARYGLTVKKINAPWSEDEIELLHELNGLPIIVMSNTFSKKGYDRSVLAIRTKRYLEGLDNSTTDNYFTRTAVAILLGKNPDTITRWIDSGWLNANIRKGRKKQAKQIKYFITRKSLRDFIIHNVALLDLEKIDKFWLVDLLVNK